jgi:transposase
MLAAGAVLQDNSRPHAAAHAGALLENFNWELFDYTPLSHDLTPNDYYLFTYLKNWLRSQCFSSKEKLMQGVKT